MQPITILDNQYPDQTLWVVGRGPSLARLNLEHIGQGPVVAINQAIGRVEALPLKNPLYSMQKDRFFFIPKRATILVHEKESAHDHPEMLEAAGALVFNCADDFGYPWDVPSVVVCVGLAGRWGCNRVVYLCCDAATDGNIQAFGEQPTYPANYLMHGPLVRRYAGQFPVEWKRI